MARRSQRLSSGSRATPLRSHKRSGSNTAIQALETKRSKSTKATPTKSQYFQKSAKPEPEDDDNDDANQDIDESSENNEDASEFDDEDDEASSSAAEDDDYGNESDEARKGRKGTKLKMTGTSSPANRTKGSELWRPGVKAGLGPGTQVVIKKPQARPAGKTPYEDKTIHPNTLLFLKDLKANNERQWLKSKFSHLPFSFDVPVPTCAACDECESSLEDLDTDKALSFVLCSRLR